MKFQKAPILQVTPPMPARAEELKLPTKKAVQVSHKGGGEAGDRNQPPDLGSRGGRERSPTAWGKSILIIIESPTEP